MPEQEHPCFATPAAPPVTGVRKVLVPADVAMEVRGEVHMLIPSDALVLAKPRLMAAGRKLRCGSRLPWPVVIR